MTERKRRVVVCVEYPISKTDGTTVRARQVVEALREEFSVTVLTRPEAGAAEYAEKLRAKGVAVVLEASRKKLWPLKVAQAVPKLRPDLVYCSADIYGFFAALLLSKLMGFRVVYEAQALAGLESMQFSSAKGMIYYLMEYAIGKSADSVVALSLKTRAFFKRLNPKTVFIPVSVDCARFGPRGQSRRGDIITVGLIGPFDNLFNAYQLEFLNKNLSRFDPKIRFLLIGECASPPSDARVTSTGFLPFARYVEAVRGLDALLVPVDKATYGPKNKVLEAMSSEVPVFTTPEGAAGLDFAENGRSAFVIPRERLVAELNGLAFQREKMAEVGKSARRVVLAWYDSVAFEGSLKGLVESQTGLPA